MTKEERQAERRAEREKEITEALREGIVAERLYKPHVAAALIGILSTRAEKTLADIPEDLIPVHRVGPSGGLRRYYGRNLLRYIRLTGDVPDPAEMDDVLRAAS